MAQHYLNQKTFNKLAVTILSPFVLFITSWNILRAYSSINNWSILSEFGAKPVYLLGSAIFWTVIGFWQLYILSKTKTKISKSNLVAPVCYFGWYWFDRLILQSSPAPNFLFSLFFSFFLLFLFYSIIMAPFFIVFFTRSNHEK